MKKRFLAILIALVMATGIVTACGNDDAPPESPPEAPAPATAPDPNPEAPSTELPRANEGGLSGSWETENPPHINYIRNVSRISPQRMEMAFEGNSYVTTMYLLINYENVRFESVPAPGAPNPWSHWDNLFLELEELSGMELIEEHLADNGDSPSRLYRQTIEGTYSLTDTQIEMITADGEIIVASFSRTENTIEIDGTRFTRMN